MIWSSDKPIQVDWSAGPIQPEEVLYEIDGPTIFTALVGLTLFFFFKIDELEYTDVFIAGPTNAEETEAVKVGHISVRGALAHRELWFIETDFELNVQRFQQCAPEIIESFLPPKGVGLLSKFGPVADSLSQTNAFMAFKFTGQSLSSKSMPLSVFKEIFDGVSDLVRHALLPAALSKGRDYRFFDFQIGQPQFASLLITIKSPEFDTKGLSERRHTRDISPESLRIDSEKKGAELWSSLSKTRNLADDGELNKSTADQYHSFLERIGNILPSEDNGIERLDITFQGSDNNEIISIDRTIGDRLVRAKNLGNFTPETVSGVITEINGESRTFLIKNASSRLITCAPSWAIFDKMDKDNAMRRGQNVEITGNYLKRKIRDYIQFEKYPSLLESPPVTAV